MPCLDSFFFWIIILKKISLQHILYFVYQPLKIRKYCLLLAISWAPPITAGWEPSWQGWKRYENPGRSILTVRNVLCQSSRGFPQWAPAVGIPLLRRQKTATKNGKGFHQKHFVPLWFLNLELPRKQSCSFYQLACSFKFCQCLLQIPKQNRSFENM